MEDLNSRLEKLLEDEKLSDKIGDLLSGLGTEEDFNAPDITELLGGLDLFSLMGGDDDGSKLLSALSPYLRPSRQKKLKDAKMLLSLYKLLPLVTELKNKE